MGVSCFRSKEQQKAQQDNDFKDILPSNLPLSTNRNPKRNANPNPNGTMTGSICNLENYKSITQNATLKPTQSIIHSERPEQNKQGQATATVKQTVKVTVPIQQNDQSTIQIPLTQIQQQSTQQPIKLQPKATAIQTQQPAETQQQGDSILQRTSRPRIIPSIYINK